MSAALVEHRRRRRQVARVLDHFLCRERVDAGGDSDARVAPEELLCLRCREARLKGAVDQCPVALDWVVHSADRAA